METRVRNELAAKITNFNMDHEVDGPLYEEIYERTGTKQYIEQLQKIRETQEDLSRLTREQLEGKYRGMIDGFVRACVESAELMALLNAIDFKISHVVGMLEEETARYPLTTPELFSFFEMNGFFSIHKVYQGPDDPEGAEVPPKKEKKSREHLRVVK